MSSYNWPVVGHDKISKFLQKSLEQNKLAHAYLFSGQEHLGKTLITENFIASILCADYHKTNKLDAKSVPCGECVFCAQLKKSIHPDVYFLEREEDKKNIGVDQVRKMKEFLCLTTFLNSYKIAIIKCAEELSESAQNALLKILEEPTPKTILILQVPDYNLLLPTIASRCQLLRFYSVADEEIYHYLVNLGEKREQAKILTALAHGQIGLAINYQKNPEIFSEYLEKMKDLLAVFDLKLVDKMDVVNSLLPASKNNLEPRALLRDYLDKWQIIIRDILFVKNHLNDLVINMHFKDELEKLSIKFSNEHLVKLSAEINQFKKYLNYNINTRLAAENLIINF